MHNTTALITQAPYHHYMEHLFTDNVYVRMQSISDNIGIVLSELVSYSDPLSKMEEDLVIFLL